MQSVVEEAKTIIVSIDFSSIFLWSEDDATPLITK